MTVEPENWTMPSPYCLMGRLINSTVIPVAYQVRFLFTVCVVLGLDEFVSSNHLITDQV